jgi:hypothetical protein
MAELELNKIIGMIMENPELVEKIKAMGTAASENEGEKTQEAQGFSPPLNLQAPTFQRAKKYEILRSIESFLSEERKRKLETIMTLADAFDSVRSKEP